MPDDNSIALFSAIVRLSVPGKDTVTGVIAEPVYGDQLQSQSVALAHQLRSRIKPEQVARKEVEPEAYIYIDWQKKPFVYPDGERLTLRYPKIMIKQLGYGPLHPDTLMSLRLAPPIHGVGLLEAIKQSDIEAKADPEDIDGDGISGKVNYVWDFEQRKVVPGRFGLKANRAGIRIQTAAAFIGDLGISNPVFPEQNCTERQYLCLATPGGGSSSAGLSADELPEHLLTLVTNFNLNLGVPKRRNEKTQAVVRGRSLFYQIGCDGCHTPSFTTGKLLGFAELSGQQIWPYTDLLLHDMGPDLADGRSDYLATGSEWRTPPLWGVGLSKQVNGSDNLLHDGRAQSIEAAIIWHAGEAQLAKTRFVQLKKAQRLALIAFVESI